MSIVFTVRVIRCVHTAPATQPARATMAIRQSFRTKNTKLPTITSSDHQAFMYTGRRSPTREKIPRQGGYGLRRGMAAEERFILAKQVAEDFLFHVRLGLDLALPRDAGLPVQPGRVLRALTRTSPPRHRKAMCQPEPAVAGGVAGAAAEVPVAAEDGAPNASVTIWRSLFWPNSKHADVIPATTNCRTNTRYRGCQNANQDVSPFFVIRRSHGGRS